MGGSLPDVGAKVLLLWNSSVNKDVLMEAVDELKKSVGEKGLVAVENLDRLVLSAHASSSFDIVYCGTLTSVTVAHPSEIFSEIARILKPGGKIVVRESIITQGIMPQFRTSSKLVSAIKLSGFINVTSPETVPHSNVSKDPLQNSNVENISLIEIQAYKPNFEIGASVPLSSISTNESRERSSSNAAKIWKLTATDTLDEDVELINEDDLLDEDDLKKPEAPLKVCGTTNKRKACKNCSCGLAEELEKEESDRIQQNRTTSSACGNCYLGDAFRCASCPYLGMPAFKPGEKINLTDRQLKADA